MDYYSKNVKLAQLGIRNYSCDSLSDSKFAACKAYIYLTNIHNQTQELTDELFIITALFYPRKRFNFFSKQSFNNYDL